MAKSEIRLIGIDDAPFDKFRARETRVIATFFRGGSSMDGLLCTTVAVDGDDATSKIAAMIKRSRFMPQLQAILTDGIAVGGFNIIDIKKLSGELKIPVIAVMRAYPDKPEMEKALRKLGKDDKIALLRSAGRIRKSRHLYVQYKGTTKGFVDEVIRISCTRSDIQEPLRLAHIIASGIVFGESRGKA